MFLLVAEHDEHSGGRVSEHLCLASPLPKASPKTSSGTLQGSEETFKLGLLSHLLQGLIYANANTVLALLS